jgi:hypothetical protein
MAFIFRSYEDLEFSRLQRERAEANAASKRNAMGVSGHPGGLGWWLFS